MNERNFNIYTQEASELNEYEWNDLAKFMEQFPSRIKRSSGPEYYKTKLLHSPFGISYVTRALDSKKKCIGLTTLTKKMFRVDNNNYSAFELGDSYVSIEYQGMGIYSKILKDALSNYKLKKNSKFLFSTPNKNSMPGLIKKGFEHSKYKIYTKILPLDFSLLFNLILLKPFAYLYLFFIKYFLFFLSLSKDLKVLQINSYNELPDKFIYNDNITQYRSKDYLVWRFINNPDNYLIYSVYFQEKYIGYMVFKESFHNSKQVLYLADIFFEKKYSSYSSKGIARIILQNYNKYAFVSTWISKKSYLWKKIFFCFPIAYKYVPFIIHKELSDDIFFEDERNIHFVLSDGDNI